MQPQIHGYAINLSAFGIIIVCLCLAVVVVSAIAIVRIIQRAGFSGWWALIIFVPIFNLLALWYFGFGPWPINRAR